MAATREPAARPLQAARAGTPAVPAASSLEFSLNKSSPSGADAASPAAIRPPPSVLPPSASPRLHNVATQDQAARQIAVQLRQEATARYRPQVASGAAPIRV